MPLSSLTAAGSAIRAVSTALVPAADHTRAHPAVALLVIEVADTSVQKDRGVKTALYAAAGIPEFWLVNLTDGTVDVYNRPTAGRYDQVSVVGAGGQLAPRAFPEIQIPRAAILP
jgi:Uma2 family endonuclease